MEEELKPCPFCSSIPTLRDLSGWEIHCKCGIEMVLTEPDRGPLIAAWNRRLPFVEEAMALAKVVQQQEPSKWTVTHNGKSVTADTLTKAMVAARSLRTDEEAQVAAENLLRAIDEDMAQEAVQARELPKPDIRIDAFGDILPTDGRKFVMGDFYSAEQMRAALAQAAPAATNLTDDQIAGLMLEHGIGAWMSTDGRAIAGCEPEKMLPFCRAMIAAAPSAPAQEENHG